MTKKIPQETKAEIFRLRREGLSLKMIGEQVHLSRPTVSKLCQGETPPGAEESSEGEDVEQSGAITGEIKSNLGRAKLLGLDMIRGINELLDDPATANAIERELELNGLSTGAAFDRFLVIEEGKCEALENQINDMRQQLILLSEVREENEGLKEQVKTQSQEIARMKKIETSFEKLVALNQDKIKPYMSGFDAGKKEVLGYIASNPDTVLKTILAGKFPMVLGNV